mgnify:CR=1 FL=1
MATRINDPWLGGVDIVGWSGPRTQSRTAVSSTAHVAHARERGSAARKAMAVAALRNFYNYACTWAASLPSRDKLG